MKLMRKLYRFLALSDHWSAWLVRKLYRGLLQFSIPAPRIVTVPVLGMVILIRSTYYFLRRVFIAEPLFKVYCKHYGRNFHTGIYIHWVQGKGDLIIGDNVSIDGKCAFFFAARYSDRPRLTIGDNTGIGHSCAFTVGKEISIGKHCRFGSSVAVFDAPGHPADPAARMAGLPSTQNEVRPIVIGDNVWIGTGSIIFPGVTIGDGSIVAMGSVVMNNVPGNTMVAGNPARQIRSLAPSVPETAIPKV
jgi:carbonic anhydrase/acetyltransferase-like protein (isoleucine patch superfamily)